MNSHQTPSTIPVLTIDGPSGSGKGTISRRVADRLGTAQGDQAALGAPAGTFGPIRADVLTLLIAIAAFYAPTVWSLLTNGDAALWSKGEHSHGPIMAAVATWLCLGSGLGLQVWALFIAWGSFYHTGGKAEGLFFPEGMNGNITSY